MFDEMLYSTDVIVGIVVLHVRILIYIILKVINPAIVNTIIHRNRIYKLIAARAGPAFFISVIDVMDVILFQIIAKVLSEIGISVLVRLNIKGSFGLTAFCHTMIYEMSQSPDLIVGIGTSHIRILVNVVVIIIYERIIYILHDMYGCCVVQTI